MCIKSILKNIREFFWPLLEPLEEEDVKQIKIEDCRFSGDEIDLELEYLQKNRDSEDNRRKEVESKATIFIGTLAVANTILINLAKEFIFNSNLGITKINNLVVLLISLTIIYLCRAIQFAIKTLKRRNYTVLGFPSFMLTEATDKKKQIFVKQYNAIKRNQKEINIKVDYMTMAQEYFQRAVITVALLTFVLLGTFMFQNINIFQELDKLIQNLTINRVVILVAIAVVIFFLVIVAILFYKIHMLEKQIKEDA